MRLLLAILCMLGALAATRAESLSDLDSDLADSLASQMSRRVLDPLEGIWRVTGMRSVIAFRADGRDRYSMIAVDVDAPAVKPGTVLGSVRPTATPGTYDAKIYTHATPEGRMRKGADFIITVDPDAGRLTLRHYYKGVAIRIWRSLPYLAGARLSSRDTRPENLDGCLRIWPPAHVTQQTVIL